MSVWRRIKLFQVRVTFWEEFVDSIHDKIIWRNDCNSAANGCYDEPDGATAAESEQSD